jgi:predicted nucleotidyltransferase
MPGKTDYFFNKYPILFKCHNQRSFHGVPDKLGEDKSRPVFSAQRKKKVTKRFSVETFILYGSAARGQLDAESDLDLLIVTPFPLSRFERHEITNIVFDVNLRYDTNFSTLVVDKSSWETGIISVLPLRDEIIRDGTRV